MKEKIVWAIDPSQNPKDSKNLIKEMKIWAEVFGCQIQPVSVFAKSILTLPSELSLPLRSPWHKNFEEVAQQALTKFLKQVSFKELLPPEIITVPSASSRSMAKALANYAHRNKSLLIFVNTSASKKWRPFTLGSFSETLISISRIPVLAISPKAHISRKLPTILFPTDFSRNSRNALMNLIPWAKKFKSKIVIYNQIETPTVYAAEFNGSWNSANVESMIKQIEKSREMKSQLWIELLKAENIKASSVIQRQRKSLSEDIISVAKANKVSLIAVASSGGVVLHAILGHIAKEVLSLAECPVVIFFRPITHRKHEKLPDYKKVMNNNEHLPAAPH